MFQVSGHGHIIWGPPFSHHILPRHIHFFHNRDLAYAPFSYFWCPSESSHLSIISMFSSLSKLPLSLKHELEHHLVHKTFSDFWRHCRTSPSLGSCSTLLTCLESSCHHPSLRNEVPQRGECTGPGRREPECGGGAQRVVKELTLQIASPLPHIYNSRQWWHLKVIKCTREGGGSWSCRDDKKILLHSINLSTFSYLIWKQSNAYQWMTG